MANLTKQRLDWQRPDLLPAHIIQNNVLFNNKLVFIFKTTFLYTNKYINISENKYKLTENWYNTFWLKIIVGSTIDALVLSRILDAVFTIL